jgi:hypothetical protein
MPARFPVPIGSVRIGRHPAKSLLDPDLWTTRHPFAALSADEPKTRTPSVFRQSAVFEHG